MTSNKIKTRIERFTGKNAEDVFTEIYHTNDWGSRESKSGKGSTIEITSIIRKELPLLFKKYNIKKLYDGACGDFNWMKKIVGKLDFYMGADIVEDLIKSNIKRFGTRSVKFKAENIVINQIENGYDAIFLRDVLVHLPNEDVLRVLENVKKSGARYLIATNFREVEENEDLLAIGLWRPMNLEIKPFNLGEPLESIHESNQSYEYKNANMTDKYLSIWEIKQ
jgi:2-polyprenyl-3-methyl-5-hydroxy-6-metoxy-1,4-benzoquinol methylase